ncbi:hypothetical protein G7046_g2748 [Stylonectria norvegica]|nr:hypothetical protein G7046_g2748 [Stylonectria norvegica]
MEAFANGQSARAIPSNTEWSRLRPIVRELYQERRWTMAQVRDHLTSLGYRVNIRMIRTRITQWTMQMNNQMGDMIAALGLLDADPALWPSLEEPVFLIRGRQVTIDEVLRFFRRKGVQHPVEWARSSSAVLNGDGVPSVSLLQVAGVSSDQCISLAGTPVSGLMSLHYLPVDSSQRAVASLRDYCEVYVGRGLATSTFHREPEVHQFTVHGRFGDRMQKGLAQMVRRSPGAFPSFHHGFDLVQPLFFDCHPMGLAQFLAIVCELVAQGAYSVLASLLRYSAAMASAVRTHDSLVEFLIALRSSSDAVLMQAIIPSVRAMLDVFGRQCPSTWHRLYIQERLCDCFYHGRERTEGSARRARLLREQEAYYGPFARNVLWTLANVADDHLDARNVDDAEEYYSTALARAEYLSGFGRAKVRFVALEGLARTERLRFDQLRRSTVAVETLPISSKLEMEMKVFWGRHSKKLCSLQTPKVVQGEHRPPSPASYRDGESPHVDIDLEIPQEESEQAHSASSSFEGPWSLAMFPRHKRPTLLSILGEVIIWMKRTFRVDFGRHSLAIPMSLDILLDVWRHRLPFWKSWDP